MEFDTGKGWLHEVHHGLQWLASVVPLPFEIPALEDCNWFDLWNDIAACARWKSILTRAVQRHIKQEALAHKTCQLHQDIFDVLQNAGLQCAPASPQELPAATFACPTCPEVFSTAKLLALHQFHAHKRHSAESSFAQGTVCPGCLKQFWTTTRLVQHFKYRPNRCFYRLQGARTPEAPSSIKLPDHLRNVKRLPSFRSHHGPIRPTPHQRERVACLTKLFWLKQEGRDVGCGWDVFAWPEQTNLLTQALQEVWEWCKCTSPDATVLQDRVITVISALEVPDGLALAWIAFFVQECDDTDDASEFFVQQLRALLVDVGHFTCLGQIESLQTVVGDMDHDALQDFSQVEVQMRHQRDRTHPIHSQYLDLPLRELEWRSKFTEWTPQPTRLLASHSRLIVHLYSGRRRTGDFQWWYEALSGCDSPAQVFSLDTAIHDSVNVHHVDLWNFLLQAAGSGCIEAILLGPPCETWSAARTHQLADQRGPRPLRNRDCPWGMAMRTWKELAQLEVGTCLLLKGLLLAIMTASCGGAAVMEHPAEPADVSAASVWRTAILHLLLDLMPMFELHTCEQWRHGARGVKPTSFLYANTDLPRWLRAWEDQTATRPCQGLIGKDAQGRYRTMAAKEYPSRLNAGLAAACHRCEGIPGQASPPPAVLEYAQTLINLCSSLDGGTMQPDYQPQS